MEQWESGVNSAPADSPPAGNSSTVEQHSPSEALKTDSLSGEQEGKQHQEAVSYERFQEVNQKYKETESQLKQLQEAEDWKAYQQYKNKLQSDPEYARRLWQAEQEYLQGMQQQAPDPYAVYPDEVANPLRQIPALQQQLQQLQSYTQQQQQQAVFNQYASRFNDLFSNAKIEPHWKDYYIKNIQGVVGNINPNALSAYDQKLIDQAFDSVHKEASNLERQIRGNYVNQKMGDITPPSTSSGAPATRSESLSSTEDRASAFAALLRSSL